MDKAAKTIITAATTTTTTTIIIVVKEVATTIKATTVKIVVIIIAIIVKIQKDFLTPSSSRSHHSSLKHTLHLDLSYLMTYYSSTILLTTASAFDGVQKSVLHRFGGDH